MTDDILIILHTNTIMSTYFLSSSGLDMASSRIFQCKTSPDRFCYVCGIYQPLGCKVLKTLEGNKVAQGYEEYFGFKIDHQDEPWAPHIGVLHVDYNCRT